MASVTDPSIPSSDGTCHYLGLSQELRYEIYRYVLTGDEEFITYEMLKEINQLQYVSKQLRAETVGLTLKFNKCVKFWSAHDIIKWNRTSNHSCLVGVTQAVNFLWACSPASARKLATVLIEVPSPRTHSVYKLPLADISGPLSSICRSRTHNHTLVKIRIASWDFKDVAKIRTFIRTGKFLEGKWVAKSPGVSSNVRFVPLGSSFDETLFSEGISAQLGLASNTAIATTLGRAKKWYAEGISGGDRFPKCPFVLSMVV